MAKHGYASGKVSPTYHSWQYMIQRCHNSNHRNFAHYGAKGITVCERWRDGFVNFLADMGEAPPGTSLDRIDSALGYYKENCRWATKTEQSRNRKSVRLTEELARAVKRLRGQGKTPRQIAQELGLRESASNNVYYDRTWRDVA